jgi:hypothetical protein
METAMRKNIIRVLLKCGAISSAIYIATDIFLALQTKGYSYTDQAISELSAIGAVTRPFWIGMTLIYAPLVIAFGIGVWMAAKKTLLRITGILIAIWGANAYVWLFFPMHMRGAIGSTTDTMHLVMSGLTVLLMVVFIALGAGAKGKWFFAYSILTILAMLVFGALVGAQAPKVAAQLPTPWMGILERISVYAPMIWVFALAVVMLKSENNN